jgi:hypothetical protein
MVLVAEVLFVLATIFGGAWWYLRTPMHRARKNSMVQPPQVAGHGGFGMYTPSNPPRLPSALHDYRKVSRQRQEFDTSPTRESDES